MFVVAANSVSCLSALCPPGRLFADEKSASSLRRKGCPAQELAGRFRPELVEEISQGPT
jgi:hypothetical protein